MPKPKRATTSEIRRLYTWFSPGLLAKAKRTYPELVKAIRPALLLGQRKAAKLDLLESKLGGVFGWPEGEPPPERLGKRLHPIIQLRKDDFPLVPFPNGRDVLQVFWHPDDIATQAKAQHKAGLVTLPIPPSRVPAAKWWNSRELTGQIAPPKMQAIHKGLVPMCACRLEPVLVDDLPRDATDVPGLRQQDLMEDRNFYLHFGNAKVGGHPSWTPAGKPTPQCRCGKPMNLLISLCPLIHDGRGNWHNPSRLFEQFGGQWMLFVCADCPERPLEAVSQLY